MSPLDDAELLRRYARERSEEAFGALVERHLGAVYGVALRQARGDTHLAQDITQVTFTALARKATELTDRAVLGGWLYRTTCFAARDAIRMEARRRKREQEALRMEECAPTASAEVDWEALRVVLDDAITELRDSERDAVWLRFFQGQTFSEIGEQLRIGESAARMRVNRSLDLLHAALSRRGVTSTTAALAAALLHQPVVAAPVGFAAKIVANATVAATSTVGTAGALSLLTMSNIKIGVAAVTALVIAGSIGVAFYQTQRRAATDATLAALRSENSAVVKQRDALQTEVTSLRSRAVLEPSGDTRVNQSSSPTPASLNLAPGLTRIDQLQPTDTSSPRSALETFLVAKDRGDVEALARQVLLEGAVRAQAATLFKNLPPASQQQYGTAEKLIATLAAQDVPVGMQIMQIQGSNNGTSATVRIQVQYDDGRVREQQWPLEKTNLGWQWLVPTKVMDHFSQQVSGVRRTPPPPGPNAVSSR